MGDIFSSVLSLFVNRKPGSVISAYAILFVVFFIFGGINHYSVISRIDTYFTTGNMVRIAEAKQLYKDNPKAVAVLDDMLANEIRHKTVLESFWEELFSLNEDPINKRIPIFNTFSTVGFFIIFMLPLLIWTFIKDTLKGKTSLTVEILSILTVVASLFVFVWAFRWVTWNIPTIFGCNGYNYAINGVIQIVLICLFSKYIQNSSKQKK